MPPTPPATPPANPPAPASFVHPGGFGRALLCVLAAAGLLLSAALAYEAWSAGALPGCGGAGSGGGCASVLTSGYARVLGVPVGVPAAGVYLLALLAVDQLGPARAGSRRRIGWAVLFAAAGAALAAAAWFTYLQAGVLHHFCPYCLATHAVGVAFALSVFLLGHRAHAQGPPPARPLAGGALAVGVLGVALLAGVQLLFPAPTVQITTPAPGRDSIGSAPASAPPGSDRTISILSGKVRLHPAGLPMLGSMEAKAIAVELVDYTCPHCRRVHGLLTRARAHFDGDFAIVVLPLPLDHHCNPMVRDTGSTAHSEACDLAKLALLVGRDDPDQFEAFHDFLMTGETPPTAERARGWLKDHLGTVPGDDEGWASAQIIRNARLWQIAEGRPLPLMFLGPSIIQGGPAEAEELIDIIGQAGGLGERLKSEG